LQIETSPNSEVYLMAHVFLGKSKVPVSLHGVIPAHEIPVYMPQLTGEWGILEKSLNRRVDFLHQKEREAWNLRDTISTTPVTKVAAALFGGISEIHRVDLEDFDFVIEGARTPVGARLDNWNPAQGKFTLLVQLTPHVRACLNLQLSPANLLAIVGGELAESLDRIRTKIETFFGKQQAPQTAKNKKLADDKKLREKWDKAVGEKFERLGCHKLTREQVVCLVMGVYEDPSFLEGKENDTSFERLVLGLVRVLPNVFSSKDAARKAINDAVEVGLLKKDDRPTPNKVIYYNVALTEQGQAVVDELSKLS